MLISSDQIKQNRSDLRRELIHSLKHLGEQEKARPSPALRLREVVNERRAWAADVFLGLQLPREGELRARHVFTESMAGPGPANPRALRREELHPHDPRGRVPRGRGGSLGQPPRGSRPVELPAVRTRVRSVSLQGRTFRGKCDPRRRWGRVPPPAEAEAGTQDKRPSRGPTTGQ